MTGFTENLGLDVYCLTLVRDVEEWEALHRLGAPLNAIRSMTFQEAGDLTFARRGPLALVCCAVAVRLGDWTLLVEQNGAEGTGMYDADVVTRLSAETEMVCVYRSVNAEQSFLYAKDGMILASYRNGAPGGAVGTDPKIVRPYLNRLGNPANPDLDLASAITGIRPKARDLGGTMLGAVWENQMFARLREMMAAG